MATAAGPVEIIMMRPAGNGPAKANPKPAAGSAVVPLGGDEIHVKTSGLTFYQKTGVATTRERVVFQVTQGTGKAIGATYDSENGSLVLDRDVELSVKRNGEPVEVHAQHAEFEHGDMIANLRVATAAYREGQATAGTAKILFREDGTAVRLDASDGFALQTATGARMSAPDGWLVFNDRNQPKNGHLQGGVVLDSSANTAAGERQSHGSSPTADLAFTADGELRHAHMERGVELTSEERSEGQAGPAVVNREWHSPVADVEFRNAGGNQVEPAWLHGVGGVVVTGQSRRGAGPVLPSKVAADDVTIDFGQGSTMSDLKGAGHASIEQTTSTGTRQTSTGDRLQAHFAQPSAGSAGKVRAMSGVAPGAAGAANNGNAAAQIEAATIEGSVVMDQFPAAKPGAQPQSPMHAVAGRADYEGAGEWIHLTENPRVNDGALELAADRIDVSQTSGDAFAHGNVKATWLNAGPEKDAQQSAGLAAEGATAAPSSAALGGQGPSHVVSAEAQLHQATGEATFRGNARLWQEANSVAAPVIVLNRVKQTLSATSADASDPVRVVMLSAGQGLSAKQPGAQGKSKPAAPQVIRVSGGQLKYSDAEHKARMLAGAASNVVAETASAQSVSDQVEMTLLPPGNHAGKDGAAAQVEELTASGHVTVTSQGRRGVGSHLVYTSETGEYVLTGTAQAPPRMVDPGKGMVTGDALIFRSGDDSVSIEGGGRKTLTQTMAPK